MKINVDQINKLLKLVKNDGTIISTYSYKNVINDDFTIDDLIEENDKFNKTLEQFDEFDNIADLSKVINLHNFDA